MAKSIRSKIKKRFRTAKRVLVDAAVIRERAIATNSKCSLIAKGIYREAKKPVNAFKFPEAIDSAFPQMAPSKPIDFRSDSLPTSGYATTGNRRKNTEADQAKADVIAVDMGGSIKGQFTMAPDSVSSSVVNRGSRVVAPAVPVIKNTIPRLVAIPRRDRNSRKAQRGTAK